jgi:hypothetical protein
MALHLDRAPANAALARMIREMSPALTTLRVDDNEDAAGLDSVCEAVASCGLLRSLALLRWRDVTPLFDALGGVVDVFFTMGELADVRRLGAALSTNVSIRCLSLCMNRLVDVSPLGAALAANSMLQELHLYCNLIENVDELAWGLALNRGLKILDLSRNRIADADVLGGALRRNTTLEHVDLRENPLVDSRVVSGANCVVETD